MGNRLKSLIRRWQLSLFHFVFDDRDVSLITLKCAVSLFRPEKYSLTNIITNRKTILTPFESCYETRDFLVRVVNVLQTPDFKVSQLFNEAKPLKVPAHSWMRLDKEVKDPFVDCLISIKKSCVEIIGLLEGKTDRTLSRTNELALRSELRLFTLLIVSLIDLDQE
jgi:hypothetical protein